MGDHIVLLDVDKTILDEGYRLTIPLNLFRAGLMEIQRKGFRVGLNSDSALYTLKRSAGIYRMMGPLVAERGAILLADENAVPEYLNLDARDFRILRNRFLQIILREHLEEYLLMVGDVNRLSTRLPPSPPDDCGARLVILVNGFRTCSMGFYVRVRDHAKWICDVRSLDEVFALLNAVGSSMDSFWGERDVDLNSEYGICIVHHAKTQKQNVVGSIIKLFPESPIYMVGDSMSDWMGDDVVHCAVANGKPEFKERCQFVASSSYTAGVLEVLEYLCT